MSVFAFIFARGGSKGVPKKNIKLFCGKPLIQYSIDIAKEINEIQECFVSTDDQEIAEIANSIGATIIERPVSLSQDNSAEWLAWKHAVKWVKKNRGNFEKFVSLPSTAPLRTIENVKSSIENLKIGIDVVMTISSTNHNPSFNMVSKNKKKSIKLLIPSQTKIHRRQDTTEIFNITTVAYVTRPSYIENKSSIWNGNVIGFEIEKENSIDIDDLHDFKIAEFLMKERLKIC